MNGPYVPVVGLEVHAQLLTASKMFCGCSSRYSGAPPDTHCCAVCAGMPGALPVVNARAVELGLLTALALHCTVPRASKFDRKNYSYPDLPKGYQISQYDDPIGRGGFLDYRIGDRVIRWGITRVHLEEDTGKTTHTDVDGREVSLVDYNRSGVPLMEIVTDPEMRMPEEAREFVSALRQVLMYLGVNDGDLQAGSMRVDVNISLTGPNGERNPKVEVKNLNSLRALERSLAYEIERQGRLLAGGETVEQETRGWSEKEEKTVPQRTKEYAHDYRYFPEPDLPPLVIRQADLDRLTGTMPEMPMTRSGRFVSQYGLTPFHAQVLTRERPLADYFERAAAADRSVPPRIYANWITGDLMRLLGEEQRAAEEIPIPPENLAELLSLIETGEISGSAGKQVLDEMFTSGQAAHAIVERRQLRQVADSAALDTLTDEVLAANPGMVDQYRKGKTNVIQALVGQAMKSSQGRANPQVVRDLLERKLN
ncbi:MAG TPA: Asp-tRNA(Asn)/Glu-tRNA(Gln) amidotransferase subunit GatB [Chloroflexota bacterium]|nr:Asp-tRNA(Asn)/Glu-tRNA(Gln) amidotransferase subunit GatB [Chloroflexota bacterium]